MFKNNNTNLVYYYVDFYVSIVFEGFMNIYAYATNVRAFNFLSALLKGQLIKIITIVVSQNCIYTVKTKK